MLQSTFQPSFDPLAGALPATPAGPTPTCLGGALGSSGNQAGPLLIVLEARQAGGGTKVSWRQQGVSVDRGRPGARVRGPEEPLPSGQAAQARGQVSSFWKRKLNLLYSPVQ